MYWSRKWKVHNCKPCNYIGIARNAKVVIPSISQSTTLSPVIQLGLNPILCDCNMDDLSVDLEHLEEIFWRIL